MGRRGPAGALHRRATALAGAADTPDGERAPDRDAHPQGGVRSRGGGHRSGRGDLGLVGPAPGARALAQRLRTTVPHGGRGRPSDDGGLCLGDVTDDGEALAHHQDWWRRAPGTKWLVLGNHDVDPINQVRPFEAERRTVTLYAAGDPPLLLTHVPLLQVPHGAVNVHGHVHEQE